MGQNNERATSSSCRSWERRLTALFQADGEHFNDLKKPMDHADGCRTCPEVQPWLYGYDAWKEVDSVLREDSGVEMATKL